MYVRKTHKYQDLGKYMYVCRSVQDLVDLDDNNATSRGIEVEIRCGGD